MIKSKEASALNSLIDERLLLKSVLSGMWNPGYAKRNEDEIKELATVFEGRAWGYIADIKELEPIEDMETSDVLASYHEEFYSIGCRAVAFVTNKKISIKAQPGRFVDINTKELYIGHFNSYEDAFEWFESLGL